MAVTPIHVLHWVAIPATLWMITLLARRPNDARLLWVTGVVVCWTTGLPFVIHASAGQRYLGIEPMTVQLIGHCLMLTGSYCLGCFYCFAAMDAISASIRAARRALVLATVILVLISATVIMPAHVRVAAAMLTAGEKTDPVRGVTAIGLFYATANLYLLYAFSTAAASAHRPTRHVVGGLWRAMMTTVAGLFTLTVSFVIFALGSITRWAGYNLPTPIRGLGVLLLLPGFGMYLVGITLPAAVSAATAARIWWYHRRTYRNLGPLWAALHAQFPEDALRAPAGAWLDKLRITGVHRRHYRRVIECRDGLVRISPYIARIQAHANNSADTPADLAHRLRIALQDRAIGVEVPAHAITIAPPATDGLDADVAALLALSTALVPNGSSAR